jgi:hypothetical protein
MIATESPSPVHCPPSLSNRTLDRPAGYQDCDGCFGIPVMRGVPGTQPIYCLYCIAYASVIGIELPEQGPVPDDITVLLVDYLESA